MVILLFETCNKQDVYHMRCRLLPRAENTTGSPLPALCTPPRQPGLHGRASCSVSIQRLYDALMRFDPETFHTDSFRPCKQAPEKRARTRRDSSPSGAVEVLPHRNSTLTIRSKSDGLSGRVKLPATVGSDTPHRFSEGPAPVLKNGHTLDQQQSPTTSTEKGRYNLSSVCTSVQFARINKSGVVHMATMMTDSGSPSEQPHQSASPSWLKLEFELKHGCRALVLFPPVTPDYWCVGAEDSASSSSDSD